MDQGRDEQAAVGLARIPYVIRFARRREAGFGERRMPRSDRPHFPGRHIGDLRSPWRAITVLGLLLMLALATWYGWLSV